MVEAAEAGFKIMFEGRDVFVGFLRAHHDYALGRDGEIGGRKLYGSLYELLAHDNDDPDYDEIRAIMKDTAIDAFPIGPGNELFGPIERRRWHSVQSAAKRCGIHYMTLKKILRALELIGDADMEMSAHKIVIDAGVMDRLLAKIASGLSFSEARDFVNASRVHWDSLLDSGYVKPFVDKNDAVGVAAIFASSDMEAFLATLLAGALPCEEDDDMLDIVSIRRRALCKFEEIIDLLLAGDLARVSVNPSERGLMSLRLSRGKSLKR